MGLRCIATLITQQSLFSTDTTFCLKPLFLLLETHLFSTGTVEALMELASVAGALLAWRLAPSQVSYYTLSGLMVKPGFW